MVAYKIADSDPFSQYLNDISKIPLLNADQELYYAAVSKLDGPLAKQARNTLAQHNLRFVVRIAKKYQNQGVELVDLVGAGNIGLMRAAEKFDYERGVKFISYGVWWIRQAILQELAEQGRHVRIPLNKAGLLSKIRKRTEEISNEDMSEVGAFERAVQDVEDRTGESTSALVAALQTPVSLSRSLFDDNDTGSLEYIADTTTIGTETQTEQGELSARLQYLMEKYLKPREQRILIEYFGLESGEPQTLEQIGTMLGITRERVRQVRDGALKKLKGKSSSLEDYL